MSDWGGTHSGYTGINAGQGVYPSSKAVVYNTKIRSDMDQPGGISFGDSYNSSFFGRNITANVNNGSVAIERVDDMCRRVMTPYFYLKQNEYPPIDGSEPALQGNDRESMQLGILELRL